MPESDHDGKAYACSIVMCTDRLCLPLQAVQQMQALEQSAKVASVASVLVTTGLLGQGTKALSVPVIASLLVAAGGSVAVLKLQQLQKHFEFLDWQHSEHH